MHAQRHRHYSSFQYCSSKLPPPSPLQKFGSLATTVDSTGYAPDCDSNTFDVENVDTGKVLSAGGLSQAGSTAEQEKANKLTAAVPFRVSSPENASLNTLEAWKDGTLPHDGSISTTAETSGELYMKSAGVPKQCESPSSSLSNVYTAQHKPQASAARAYGPATPASETNFVTAVAELKGESLHFSVRFLLLCLLL